MTKPDISIIIPVYRAAESLPALHARIVQTMEREGIRFEIIFVEDAGGDNSWSVIEQLCSDDARVKALRMSRNYGQHNAVLAGIRHADAPVCITMDDDLQHPPEELPKVLAVLSQGYDVVYAPPERQQHGLLRNLASKVTKAALQGAMGADVASKISALRAFRTELRGAFGDYHGPSVNIDVLLTWATTNFGSVAVRHDARAAGVSGYSTAKLLAHAFNMITGFSTLPLRVASVIGLAFTLFGGGVFFYVVVRYFLSPDGVAGFPFLASVISIFAGAQLLALGIIGEYLGRMFQRSMGRPTYLVRELKMRRPDGQLQ